MFSKQQLTHEFVNEPLNLSVHPNGMFVCVSFVNSIQIYISTIDRFILFHQFDISMSTIVGFRLKIFANQFEFFVVVLRLNIVIKDIS